MLTDELREQIPYYLTKEAGEGILKELASYNCKTDIFLQREIEGILQGDGWRGFTLYDFQSSSTRSVRAIVISNSCDIDATNKREMPTQVTFVPLMKLSKVEEVFLNSGCSQQAVSQKIKDIRAQKVTSFFFIPGQGTLDDDYVAWLSNVHSMPMASFTATESKQRLFTLNMTGFYLFLFKLSIHFCRFHERVDRFHLPNTMLNP